MSAADEILHALAVWMQALPDGWPGAFLATVVVSSGAAGLLLVILMGVAALVVPDAFRPEPGEEEDDDRC